MRARRSRDAAGRLWEGSEFRGLRVPLYRMSFAPLLELLPSQWE